jgi:hypothetical protein
MSRMTPAGGQQEPTRGQFLAEILGDPDAPMGATPERERLLIELAGATVPGQIVAKLEALALANTDASARALIATIALEQCLDAEAWERSDALVDLAQSALQTMMAGSERDSLERSVLLVRGVRSLRHGHRAEAAELLARLSAQRGYFGHMAHTYLGLLALDQGDAASALSELRRAMEVEPDPGEAFAVRGWSQLLVDALASRRVADPSIQAYRALMNTTAVPDWRRRFHST